MGLFDRGPTPDGLDQTDEEKKLVAHVREKIEECRSSAARMAHEGIWMTNIAYLLGYDGVQYNTTTRQFQPINRASAYVKRNRLHVNKVLPTIQNRLARLCKNPPKYDVRPESNDTEDKEAARLSLQILGSKWESLSLNEKRLYLYMWVQQCGHAYMKVSWDSTDGGLMVDPVSGDTDFLGDVRADIVSPFEIFPNPLASTFDDVRRTWLIQAKVRKLDYFRTQYKERGQMVKAEDCWLMSAQFESKINNMSTRAGGSGTNQEAMKNSAIEMIKYEAPSREHPLGRMIVAANGVLLENKPLPVGEIPFAKFDDIVIGGKYNSESTITHLRPIQDHKNEVVRRRAEWTKKLLAGKYKAAKGSELSQETLNDQSGEVVYYTPVTNAPNGPEPVQVPNIPQWAYSEEDRVDAMFNDVSGISEVSRGNIPSASIPAIGMQLLTEQDDTRIGVMTEQHEHSWARVGSLILKHVEAFYTMPRKLKIAGKNLQYTVKEITGEMIRGNTDVTVIRGSTLPGSKTLKNQEIMNRYQAGLFGNPQDPRVQQMVNEMTEFGNIEEGFIDYGLDMAQIKKGIERLERGELVQITEFDNQALWLQELNRYRKGDKFESLPEDIKGNFVNTMEAAVHGFMQVNNMVPPPVNPEQVAQEVQAQTGPTQPPPPGVDPMSQDPGVMGAA